MAQSKLTLIGMYNYDSTLFDTLSLPSGVDKTLLINTILLNGGEFEVLYSDLDFIKEAIGAVSHKWYRTIDKWYTALQIKYDPLYNFDRYEEWTDSGTDTGTVKRAGSNTGSVKRTGSNTGTVTTDNDTSTSETSRSSGTTNTYVNAYNNNTLVQDGQSASTQSAESSSKGTNDTTETRALTNTDNETRDLASTDDETRNLATSGAHSGHLYGNIGVTTSQQMLESELQIAEWSLYDHIADLFIKDLCIAVY